MKTLSFQFVNARLIEKNNASLDINCLLLQVRLLFWSEFLPIEKFFMPLFSLIVKSFTKYNRCFKTIPCLEPLNKYVTADYCIDVFNAKENLYFCLALASSNIPL